MAYQSGNATFYHGSMSTFDATNLPGDPMGQGPYGLAPQWPGPFNLKEKPGCTLLSGTISARYPIPLEYGRFQKWVTGPKGQNFAEGDNYGSYNNVGYRGQIWPASFATPQFQLAAAPDAAPSTPNAKPSKKPSRYWGDWIWGLLAIAFIVLIWKLGR